MPSAMSPNETTKHWEQVLKEVREIRARTTAERIWDVALKTMIPTVLILVGWGISVEVRLAQQDGYRGWLKDGMAEIKSSQKEIRSNQGQLTANQQEILSRLRAIEKGREPK